MSSSPASSESDQPSIFDRVSFDEKHGVIRVFRGERRPWIPSAPAREDHVDLIRKLEAVALDVASRRPTFTMAHVRDAAEQLGWLTGDEGRPNPRTGRLEQPRALAFLGALLPGIARLGLVEKIIDAAGRTVYAVSERQRANNNKQAVWKLTPLGGDAVRDAGGSLMQLREMIRRQRER